MKKGFGIPLLLGLALLLAFREASAQGVQRVEWRLQIKADSALVRATPDEDGAILLTLAKGTMLPSFEKTGEWFRVVVEAGEAGLTVVGYIAAPDVEVMKAIVRSVGDFWTEESGEFRGLGLSVRIYGGAGFLKNGDANLASRGMFLAAAAGFAVDESQVYDRVEKFGFTGPEINVDLLYRLTPLVSVGLGAGVLESGGRGFLGWFQNSGDTARLETKPTLQIVPLRLGLMFTLPVHRLFNIYAQGGAAYYRAKFGHQLMVAGAQFRNAGLSAVSRAIGIHVGCGAELVLTSRGAWFIEAQGRYARFKNFSGLKLTMNTAFGLPNRERIEGDLYFFDDRPYPRLDILAGTPAGGPGERRLVYDLKGVSIVTGIRVKF